MQLTRGQQLKFGSVAAATVSYVGLGLIAPHRVNANPYALSPGVILVLSLTIVGLLWLAWWFGFYAWLELDRYARRLPRPEEREAFDRIASGVWLLTAGLIVTSLISATKPFYAGSASLTTLVTQLNYYIIIVFPFVGFMRLRWGSLHLAVAAQAVMSLQSKLLTVGAPVLLLASFYVFLMATNSAPDAQTLTGGPLGFLVLPINIVLVVGSWVFGLLAALNIERATHMGEGARLAQPLAKLYNGILTMTGGYIILDALMSLGATRLQALPVTVVALLLYGFIGVVALGFWLVARSARALGAALPVKTEARD